MKFFADNTRGSGPTLTDEMVQQAETRLGLRLPAAYIELARERNGGIPLRRCFRTTFPSSWAADHIEVSMLLGIGFEEGIDGELGSAYLVQEWGYPDVGLVCFDTPSAGHDTVMLDYRKCGPDGEPSVVYIDEDRKIYTLADTFADFVSGLVACESVRTGT